ncbi:MAG TPA: Gfo/Idh/MocA family oxidoreductase [Terriglobales bacterium]|nr:Gfo/Idh/MocA family oxidoreductase [Terriglobales bacterium]
MVGNARLRVAVIGLGIGARHADRYAKLADARLTAVCDRQESLAANVAARYGCAASTDAERMLDEHAPDAVSICTPPATHAALTEAAAARGIHVLVEKPMAPSTADCDRMIAACRNAGVRLMVGHKKRFAPPFVRLRELAAPVGPLGAVRQVIARYVHGGMPDKDWFWARNDGGGPVLENHVHAADVLGFVAGRPSRVHAEGALRFVEGRAGQLNLAAYSARFLGLEPGRDVVVSVGYGMVGPIPFPVLCDEHWLFACERGVAEVSGPFDNPSLLRWAPRGAGAAEDIREERWPDADPFRGELEHFLNCVRHDRPPRASGEEARHAVEFCLAVQESARSGRTVVFANGSDACEPAGTR